VNGRRVSLATKALVWQVAAVLAIATAVAVPRYFALRSDLYGAIETSAENLLQVLEDLVNEHPELLQPGALDAVIDRFARKLPAVGRVSVITPDGHVVADSRLEVGAAVGDSAMLSMLRATKESGESFSSANPLTLRRTRLLRGRYDRIRHSDIVGVAAVEMRLGLTNASVRRELINEMALVLVLLLPIGALLYLATRRTFVRPLERLVKASVQFSRGEVPPRLTFGSRDELEVVAFTFNEMVAARTAALQEREERLAEAQAEVKVLEGILPICASCKRIRTDGGQWQAVESYVREHSQAEFSHGVCPDCARRDWGAGTT
jgi:methyl-accepting chemotaxis protein